MTSSILSPNLRPRVKFLPVCLEGTNEDRPHSTSACLSKLLLSPNTRVSAFLIVGGKGFSDVIHFTVCSLYPTWWIWSHVGHCYTILGLQELYWSFKVAGDILGPHFHLFTVLDQGGWLSWALYFRTDSTNLQNALASTAIRWRFRRQVGCLLGDFHQLGLWKDGLQE